MKSQVQKLDLVVDSECVAGAPRLSTLLQTIKIPDTRYWGLKSTVDLSVNKYTFAIGFLNYTRSFLLSFWLKNGRHNFQLYIIIVYLVRVFVI